MVVPPTSDDVTSLPTEVPDAPNPSREPRESPALEELVKPGQLIDRYVVLGRLGAGGMGLVLAAYDPELDRKIALKLVLPQSWSAGTSSGRARLIREAQAMARLSHPNVVAVYDVGTVGEHVFVAMEFVDGATLQQWLDEEPRSTKEVLEIFRAAGRGLAAAHEKDLVHRDFKPDNVMLGDDGRVRVMDFGLAREHVEASIDGEIEPRSSASGLSAELTQAGAVMGTPAYMAPEQHLGLPTDARTDQFSFCVALWEALHGRRPFAGETRAALAFNVCEGIVADPPTSRASPSWLRAVLLRGLSVDPEHRYSSMGALLDALARDPTRRRRRLIGATALVLVAASTGLSFHIAEREMIQRCEESASSIDGQWNPDVAKALSDGFANSGVEGAGETFARIVPRIDAYVSEWKTLRESSCLAAKVEETRHPDVHASTVACLDERRAQLGALLLVMQHPDRDVVFESLPQASRLPLIARCNDEAWLAKRVRLPDVPADRKRVEDARSSIAAALAQASAGKHEDARKTLDAAAMTVEGLGWPPLGAEFALAHGRVQAHSGELRDAASTFEEAFYEASKVGHDAVAAEAAMALARIEGHSLEAPAAGLRWGRIAEVLLTRVGELGGPREAELHAQLAPIHSSNGDFDAARAEFERALALYESSLGAAHPLVAATRSDLGENARERGLSNEARVLLEESLEELEDTYGPDHPEVMSTLNRLAMLDVESGRISAAIEQQRRILSFRERYWGPEHPHVAEALSNLGHSEQIAGDHDAALAAFERALDIRKQSLGPEHSLVGLTLANIAELHQVQGKIRESRAMYAEALAIMEKAKGGEHPDLVGPLINSGFLLEALGERDEALAAYERAGRIMQNAAGEDHPVVATALNNAGSIYQARGDLQRARANYERALSIRERVLEHGHPDLAAVHSGLGEVEMLEGRPETALPHFDRALDILERAEGMEYYVALVSFSRARARWQVPEDQGGGRSAARRDAERARELFSKFGPVAQAEHDEVVGWLKRHRP